MTGIKLSPAVQRKLARRTINELIGDAFLQNLDDQVRLEVIRKMDSIFYDLLENEALLEESRLFMESVLATMSAILVVCDRSGAIEDAICPSGGGKAW